MKTLVWLQNTNSDKNDSDEDFDNKSSDEKQFEEGSNIFDHEMPCMEINDLEEEFDKENI